VPGVHHVRILSNLPSSPPHRPPLRLASLRGEQFCFFHHPTRRPTTRTRLARTPFDVPPITDPENLQITLSEIIRRLADNTLDTKRASLLLITLQMAKTNLAAMPNYSPDESFTRETASSTAQSSDFPDLSGLLSVLGLQPNPTTPGH
jgi:hypothetical protein